ncbi:MAG: serine hydrolase, partial [Bacteroidota bacterium]
NTFVYRRRYQPEEIKNYAQGYLYSDSLKRKILPDEKGKDFYCVYLDGIFGDGMVNSTLQDLFKWDRALYADTLVNEEDKKLVFASHQTREGVDTGYGYGWFVKQDSLSGKIVSHSGGWAGYTTFIERHIDKDKTIILLQNNRTKLTKVPLRNTRRILYGQPVEVPFSLEKRILLRYVGDYDSGNGNVEKIDYEFDRLWSSNRFELQPISPTKFKLVGFRPTVTFEFILDSNENVEKLRIQQVETGLDEIAIRQK